MFLLRTPLHRRMDLAAPAGGGPRLEPACASRLPKAARSTLQRSPTEEGRC